MTFEFQEDPISLVLAAFSRGEIVVVTDHHLRENEGDLFLAAESCTPEKLAFFFRYTCGIVCTPMTQSWAKRLELPLMVVHNTAPFETAFTISIDAREGTTTGISASDRSKTICKLADLEAKPHDFVRPGHVFPLIARKGGVLERLGHTEASCDLCTLTGQAPVAVICELTNDDGTVMKGKQIYDFAREHGLRLCTVEQLAWFRWLEETHLVECSMRTLQYSNQELIEQTFCTTYDEARHSALSCTGRAAASSCVLELEVMYSGGKDLKDTNYRAQLGANTLRISLDFKKKDNPAASGHTKLDYEKIGVLSQILRTYGVNHVRCTQLTKEERNALKGLRIVCDPIAV